MLPACLALLLAGCLHGERLPLRSITVGQQRVKVEVADDPEERAQGLMFRESLAADRGMLFVYPEAALRSFWMENTTIPLSIAFLDAHGVVVRIRDMKPMDRSHVLSGQPALYALEMNKGWFQLHDVEPGLKIGDLPGPAEH